MEDTYRTISTPGNAIYTEKRSKFIAFACHIDTEEEAKGIIDSFRKKFYDARHVCYAYNWGRHSQFFRSSDDGEPSGTAGKPILGQLKSFDLTYSLIIVVRYFGGVKLGTGGLVVAYKTAAAEALNDAAVIEEIVCDLLFAEVPYSDADTAMRFVREAGAEIINRDYTSTDTLLTIKVREKDTERLEERLRKILTLRLKRI